MILCKHRLFIEVKKEWKFMGAEYRHIFILPCLKSLLTAVEEYHDSLEVSSDNKA